MSYANVQVAFDLGEAAPDRLRPASGLALRFEATLTGVASAKVPPPVLVKDIHDAQRQYDEAEAAIRTDLEAARQVFLLNASKVAQTDWCGGTEGSIKHFVQQTRSANLLVVGRCGPKDADSSERGVDPGPVLMEAGRSVLVVPPGIEDPKGARIVVAWKDTLEARRAVSGALGFIQRADQIFVVTAGEGARFECAQDVASHLARHGAHVNTHLLTTAGNDADERPAS